jgi:RHS repeat-associated protein
MDKRIKILFIGSLLAELFSGCSKPVERSGFDSLMEKARGVTANATLLVRDRSTANAALSTMTGSERTNLKVKPFGPLPSSFTQSLSVKPKRLVDVFAVAKQFYLAKESSRMVTCGTYNDPAKPTSDQTTFADYYSRPTSSVVAAADKLGSIDQIFDFVHEEIKNGPLFAATQSADTLLLSRVGSVADKANLLVAMLRVRRIPAKIITGEIYLKADNAKRFFQSRELADVIQILTTMYGNYYSNPSGEVDGSPYFTVVSGVRYLKIPHMWVRAYDGTQWVNFDPTELLNPLALRKKGLTDTTASPNLASWLFGPDSDGQYVKSKTLIDFELQTSFIDGSVDYTNTIDSISAESRNQNIVTDLPPCIEGELLGVENSNFEYRAEIVVNDLSSSEKMRVNFPAARIAENRAYLSHTAGVLSEISSPSTTNGYVQYTIGTDVVAQFQSYADQHFRVSASIIYPKIAVFGEIKKDFASDVIAAGVFHTNIFGRPVSEGELIKGLEDLRLDVANVAPSKIIFAGIHRLSGLLAQFKFASAVSSIFVMRGVRTQVNSVFGTSTTFGALVTSGQVAKELGFLPTQPGIDWAYHPLFTAYPEGLSPEGYAQTLGAAGIETLLAGSQAEATIWEELFGLRGYSAERTLQRAASVNSASPGTYSFIQGVELTSANIAAIGPSFSSLMVGQFAGIQSTFAPSGSAPGVFLWAMNKEFSDPDSGAKVVGYIIDGGAYGPKGALFTITDYGHSLLEEKNKLGNAEDRTGIFVTASGPGVHNDTSSTDKSSTNLTGLIPYGGGGAKFSETRVTVDEGNTVGSGTAIPGAAPGVCSSNPVDYVTGQMWHQFTDLSLIGHTANTGLNFQRTYLTTKQYNTAGSWVDQGDFGMGWVHNFDTRILDGSKNTAGELTMGSLASGTSNVLWITDAGNTVLFTLTSGVYHPPTGLVASFQAVGSTYVLTLKGNIKYTFKKDLASNFNGRLIKITDPHAEDLTLSYDSNGRLDTVTSPFAGDLKFYRDGSNKLIKVQSIKNSVGVGFTYQIGKLASSTDLDGNKTTYQYNTGQVGTLANGLLASFTDPLNRSIRFEYYQNGKVFKEVGLGHAQQVYNYAPYLYERYTRVMAPNGYTTEYRYDNNFRVALQVMPDAGRRFQTWTSDGRIQSVRDGLGYETDFTYDSRGNQTGVKKPNYSGYAQVAYDSTFDVPTSVTPRTGGQTTLSLNSSNGDVNSVSRTGLQNAYTYTSFGGLLSTSTGVSSFSNLANSDGFTKFSFHTRNPQTMSYDGRGRVIQRKFTNGRTVYYSYDNFDRVIYIGDTDGPAIRNTYDIAGRLVKQERITQGSTQIATFEYDERDRMIAQNNFAGERTEYKYDIVGVGCLIQDKPTQIIAPDGKRVRFEYDPMGRKIREVLPDGSENFFDYNLRGDLIAVMDSLGNLSQFEYDGNGRLAKMLRQSAGFHKNVGTGAFVSQMPEAITFEYDEADRLIRKKQMLVDEQSVSGAYVTEFQYDDLDRPIQKTIRHMRAAEIMETIDTVLYEYYSQIQPSLVSKVANRYMVLNFTYETQPPYDLLKFTESPTTEGKTLGLALHQYEISPSVSGPRALIVRDGYKVGYNVYDPSGRVLSASGYFSNLSNTATFSYDNQKRRTGISHTSGLSAAYTYDDADRLASILWSGGSSISETLTRTKSGLISKLVREIGTFNYGYTPRNELSSISYSGSETLPSAYVNTTASYDAGGNLIDGYAGRTFSSVNNFTTVAGTQYKYTPDSSGLGRVQTINNSVNAFETEFEYLPEGQMKNFSTYYLSTSAFQASANYYYDGLGRRIAKVLKIPSQSDAIVTYSHLGTEDRVITASLKKGSSSQEVLYIDGQGIDDHLFEISSASGAKAYITDHLGSVINSAAIGGKSVYGSFGETLGTAPSSSSLPEPVTYAFAGREYDPESGFYFMRKRNYDPNSAHFLTKDPLGPEAGGDINPYRYVHNNPVGMTDPSGMCDPISGSALLIGAGIGAAAGGGAAYLGGERDPYNLAAAAGIGAVAGATSVVAGAYAVGYAAASFVGGGIGLATNLSTQYATGASNINWTSAGFSTLAGAAGGAAGVAVGNMAFAATPVIGNPIGVQNAITAAQVAATVGSGVVGGGGEVGWSVLRHP